MPIYEYECEACGHLFEAIQRMSEERLRECPECGSAVRRLLSAPAVQFKGSGWYVTDYGGRKGSSDTESKPSAKESSPKSDAKSPSEPAKSTASTPSD